VKESSPEPRGEVIGKRRLLFQENESLKGISDDEENQCKFKIELRDDFYVLAIDTQWVIDLIEKDEKSPEKLMNDVDEVQYETKSDNHKKGSKAHLKTFFSSNKFNSTKTGIAAKQVTVAPSRKLNFNENVQPVNRKL